MFYRLRRRLTRLVNETVYRVDYAAIRRALERLELPRGSVVCVHSALRNLGHLVDGPGSVIKALQDAVGPDGAVLMPTFSFGGAMLDHVKEPGVFDVRETPSKVGFLTEQFRKQEGVLRSLHPTHSVAGWGARAEEFLTGHERSMTPFGPGTPYARLVDAPDGYMLMLETRLLSLPHHLQERVSFPNLYLPESRALTYRDAGGNTQRMETRVMRPRIPYFVAIPAPSGDEPAWCTVHDFCLLFPKWRKRELDRDGVELSGHRPILRRRAELESAGVLHGTRLGKGELGLLHVRPFVDVVQPELEAMLQRYAGEYELANVARKNGLQP